MSSELLAKERKGQGPCTLALRAQKELNEPMITAIVIEQSNRERDEKRKR